MQQLNLADCLDKLRFSIREVAEELASQDAQPSPEDAAKWRHLFSSFSLSSSPFPSSPSSSSKESGWGLGREARAARERLRAKQSRSLKKQLRAV